MEGPQGTKYLTHIHVPIIHNTVDGLVGPQEAPVAQHVEILTDPPDLPIANREEELDLDPLQCGDRQDGDPGGCD